MADYYEKLMQVGAAPGGAPAAPGPDYAAQLIGDGSSVSSNPLPGNTNRTMPTVVDEFAHGASPWTIARASLAPNVKDQIRRYAAARFPGMPLDEAIKFYGTVDGDIVYAGADGRLYREVPSVDGGSGARDTLGRASQWSGTIAGQAIPMVAGGAAGAVIPGGVPSVLAAGTAAAGADYLRQVVDRALAGEPISDVDWTNIMAHGASASAGQTIGLGAKHLLSRNPLAVGKADRTAAMDPARLAEIGALEKNAKELGIDLSAGQATGLRSLLAAERQLGRHPETMDRIYGFAANQREVQVPAAVRSELNRIAPEMGAEAAIQRFRAGGDAVVEQVLAQRSARAREAYSAALDRDPYWSEEAAKLLRRPSMQEAWKAAQRRAAERGEALPEVFAQDPMGGLSLKTQTVPDWRAWDAIKRGLDDVIERGTDPVTRKLNGPAADVAGTKRELLKILDEVNPDYARARALYGSDSDAVNAVLDGGVGLLKRMDGPERQEMVNAIFSGSRILPEEIGRMRSQFAFAGRLDDWNAGLRQYLTNKLDQAMVVNADATRGNVPGKFYKSLWGDERQKAAIEAAIGDKTTVDGIDRLMQVLQAASRSLPEGSPTATDLGAMMGQTTLGPTARFVGKVFSPQSWANLGNDAVAAIDRMRLPAYRQQLAEKLLGGDYKTELSKLRMLTPEGDKALEVVGHILTQVGASRSANAAIPTPDALPEIYGATK